MLNNKHRNKKRRQAQNQLNHLRQFSIPENEEFNRRMQELTRRPTLKKTAELIRLGLQHLDKIQAEHSEP